MLDSFRAIDTLPVDKQLAVRRVYAAAYSQQMRVMLYFCIVSLVSLLLLFERKPRRLVTTADGELAGPQESE